MKRWKPIADYLQRHGIAWCGVWQQQKRGAWHHHVLANRYVDVVALREFSVRHGWGPFLNIRRVGERQNPQGVVNYLLRYLTRDYCGHVPVRVRLASGQQQNSVGTTRFSWVDGLARAWRVGAELWTVVNGRVPRCERDRREAFDFGLFELGFLDFARITEGANPYG